MCCSLLTFFLPLWGVLLPVGDGKDTLGGSPWAFWSLAIGGFGPLEGTGICGGPSPRSARHAARSATSGTGGPKALAAAWLGGLSTHRVCVGARLQIDPKFVHPNPVHRYGVGRGVGTASRVLRAADRC